jgi:hypothetical protein
VIRSFRLAPQARGRHDCERGRAGFSFNRRDGGQLAYKAPLIDSPEFKKLIAGRRVLAERQFQRMQREEARKRELLAPLLLPLAASPDAQIRSAQFLKELIQHAPQSKDTQSPLAAPYPLSWKEIHPDNAPIDWYGPDGNTGRVGAKLVSQAAGDRLAYSDLGILFTSDHDAAIRARVVGKVALAYYDEGGVGPSSTKTRAALGVSIDAYSDPPQYGYAAAENVLWNVEDSFPVPGFPYFTSSNTSDFSVTVEVDFQAHAGISYGIWAVVGQWVGTWGSAGAQSNLDMTITDIRCVEL